MTVEELPDYLRRERPRKRNGGLGGWPAGCAILLGSAIAAFLLLAAIGLFRSDPSGARLGLGHRVGLIEVNGAIDESGPFCAELRRLRADTRVSALVVRIDSPGGGVAATQEIHRALQEYREKTGRPIVASLGSAAASGGYYVACAADTIMAEPGTLTGSIGVLFSLVDASAMLEKVGLRVEIVKSGDKKDFGGWWRPLSSEERGMLEGVMGDVYEQFVDAVIAGRRLDPAVVRELADGRVFSGRQALAAGLVDTLGYESDAIALAATLAGLDPETAGVVRKAPEPFLFGALRRLLGRAEIALEGRARLEYR